MNTKAKILEFIKKRGKVRAEDLRREFSISRVMVHKHLINLQKEGSITKSGKPPIVFYIFSQSVTQKNEADRITKILVEKYKPEKVILFGSVARGEETKDSDLDLFVVKNTKRNYFDRLTEAGKFIKTDRDVDLIVYTPQEFDKALKEKRVFINQVLKYGKTLYDSNYVQ